MGDLTDKLKLEFSGHSREYYLGFLSAAKFDGCIKLSIGWHEKTDNQLMELCIQAALNQYEKLLKGEKLPSDGMSFDQFNVEITKLYEMEKSIYDSMVDKKTGTEH